MYLFWGMLFLMFIFIELITLNLVTIWFAFGSIVTLIVSFFTDSFVILTIIFIISSLLSLFLARPFLMKIKRKGFEPTNSDRYVGKRGEVTKKITSREKGEVKVLGTIWAAASDEDLEVGDKIVVLKIDGVKLIVKKEEK